MATPQHGTPSHFAGADADDLSALMAAFWTGTPAPLLVVGRNGTITAANAAAGRLFEVLPADLRSVPFLSLIASADVPAVAALFDEVWDNGAVPANAHESPVGRGRGDVAVYSGSSSTRLVRLHLWTAHHSQPDESLSSIYVECEHIGSIVEARALHQAAAARFRAVFDASPTGIALCSPDGPIREANGTLAELLGTTPDDLVGARLTQLIIGDDDREVLFGLADQLREGTLRGYHIQASLHTSHGTAVEAVIDVRGDGESGPPQTVIAHVIPSSTGLQTSSSVAGVFTAQHEALRRQLHDGPIQDLVSAQRLPVEDPRHKQLLAAATDTLRDVMAGLWAPADEGSLHERLRQVADSVRSQTDGRLDVTVVCDVPVPLLRHVPAALTTIALQAARNSALHADAASKISIVAGIDDTEGLLHLTVRDDGKGFPTTDVAELVSQRHLGMSHIADLAATLGGELVLGNPPSGGAVLEVRVPVDRVAGVTVRSR